MILIVDDDPIAREGLSAVLHRAGFPTATAGDAEEALEYLGVGVRPDLILLDMMMPRSDGWQFLHVRRQQAWRDIPVWIITGMGIASDEWAASLGARGLLRKPIDIATLLDAVRR